MLIEFTFSNFRSFRDSTTLSMVAAKIISEDKSVDQNNLIPFSPNLELLTSAAIYGANASGKSNLVAALSFMRRMVLNSSRETLANEPIDLEPFRLSSASEEQPACFEVIFLLNGQKYRYGFEATRQRIVREWLHTTPTQKEAVLFSRAGDEIQVKPRSFKEGRGLEQRTRSNALFLSVVAQFNGPIASRVLGWFKKLGVISGLNDDEYQAFTTKKFMQDGEFREEIKRFVCALDVGIEDIQGEKVDPESIAFPPNIPEELKAYLLKSPGELVAFQTQHKKYDQAQNMIGLENFDLSEHESEGTKKLFFLAGPVLDTLITGRVLVIDEMEARMHPLITLSIIRLFNSTETNPKRAQLIFTTHDTNLLDRSLFRRDQIWFTEKDRFGGSHLYSLVEFKPRNDALFEKDYLRGRYGAVPYPGELASSIQHAITVAEEKADYDA